MDDAFSAQGTSRNTEPRNFYVYAHRDSQGTIFYIGKGTGKRAWSQERHPVWHRYVQERLNGAYAVEIIEKELTETEAEEREGKLIAQLGSQLVNWQNPGRGFDYAALEKYHALRGANLLFVASTRPIEASDINNAIDRYRQALNKLREYESLVVERGLVAEFSSNLKIGDLTILDRLTLCLVRSGRSPEARAAAERYFEDFPGARGTRAAQRILKRIGADRSGSASGATSAVSATGSLRRQWKPSIQDRKSPKGVFKDIAIPENPVERNLRGRALEREGFVDNAIEFYEANVRDRFEGSFPYDRLAVIFRQRGDVAAEIVVLKRAIEVFGALQNSPRADVSPKLARFTTRLWAAQRLAEKTGMND